MLTSCLRSSPLSYSLDVALQWMSAPNIAGAPLPQRARGFWKARVSAQQDALERLLEAERAQLPPWLVVGFASGIAAWFTLGSAGAWAGFICTAAALSLAGFTIGSGRAGWALGWFTLAAALGCSLVWARAEWVRAPRLERPVVTQVTGRVEAVDHLAAKQTLRLMIRTEQSDLPPRSGCRSPTRTFPPGWPPGRGCRCAPGWRRRRQCRCRAPTISRVLPGSSRRRG